MISLCEIGAQTDKQMGNQYGDVYRIVPAVTGEFRGGKYPQLRQSRDGDHLRPLASNDQLLGARVIPAIRVG